MTLKGTKTANNLMHAFAGESQARKRTCQKINEINE